MKYVLRPTQNDILHYGVDHLHSKDGRGSGRYPWGSGKEGGNKKSKNGTKKPSKIEAGKAAISAMHNRYSKTEKDAIKKTKKAINTVASNYAKYETPFYGKMEQWKMLDNKLNESNKKAKEDYDEAITILGKNKVEQIVKAEKYKRLIIPNAIGLAVYGYAISKAPKEAKSMVVKSLSARSVISLSSDVHKINRNYSKASKYLNNKK